MMSAGQSVDVSDADQPRQPAGPPPRDVVNQSAASKPLDNATVVVDPSGKMTTTKADNTAEASRDDVAGRIDARATSATVKSQRKTCILKLDGCHYTIVANRVADDTKRDVTTQGKFLPRTGSLTVLKRTTSAGSCGGSVVTERPASAVEHVMTEVEPACDEHGDVDVAGTSPPPADSTAALKFCSTKLREILRLREILGRLSSDQSCSKDDLIETLEYAARVAENIYVIEVRMTDEGLLEDDVLGVVEPDRVPREVRDWLTMTFTRTPAANVPERLADKLKFRSVAHAIRAGIVVDRIYRRMSSSSGQDAPPAVQPLLKEVDDWSFDVFALNDVSDGHAPRFVGCELLRRYDVINKFKINNQVLENFLAKLELGYSKFGNPYHNLLHGADVAQTSNAICSQSGLVPWMTDLEIFAIILSSLIHDYEHTGTTNTFHINTDSEVALVYNDRAVLENYHVSAVFRLFRDDDYNILHELKSLEYRELRSLVIELVLATDMSNHFQQIKTMKNLLAVPDNIDKTSVLALIVHCSDVSHPAKNWKLHHRWTSALLEEFFRQGDREAELGLPISPLCDRHNTLVAESQIGFIEFIVDPSFHVMNDAIAALTESLQQQWRRGDDDATADDVTVTSPETAEPTPPPTPPSADKRKRLVERWQRCLAENKSLWRERAVADAVNRNSDIQQQQQQDEHECGDTSSGVTDEQVASS